MAKRQHVRRPGLEVPGDQPLIGVLLEDGGQEVVRYFTDEAEADAALPRTSIEDALSLAGAWSDLDWEDLEAGLDRIRHESSPSPPITL